MIPASPWLGEPWAGMLAVAGILVAAIALAAGLKRRALIGGEAARKLVHVVLGVTVAGFPWLFTESWPVWLLAGGSLLGLAALRWLPWLRRGAGAALHGVERESWGEFCFPVAVVAVWACAPGDWIRFSLPMLILATADAVAALVGRRYGQTGYSTAGGRKSWEGSFAFAAATFLVVHVPLLLLTDTGRGECLLIALNLALLLMLVEGLAWDGYDNLFIPIAAMILIDDWLAIPLADVLRCTAAIIALAIGCWWWRSRTTLDDAAVLGCAVLGYVFWAAGGWLWLLAPLALFLAYGWLAPPGGSERLHRTIVPFTILLPGLAWLLVDRRLPGDGRWLIAAASTFTTQLAAICLLAGAFRHPQRHGAVLLLRAWLPAVTLILLPTVLVGYRGPSLAVAGLAALGSLLGLLVFWAVLPDRRQQPADDRRWGLQSLAAGLGSLLVLTVPRL